MLGRFRVQTIRAIGKSAPVNYRIYNKQEGKTKNDYLPEMIVEVLTWGLSPKTVTTDTWYSSQKNLKFFIDLELGFLTGIAKNRSCSVDGKILPKSKI